MESPIAKSTVRHDGGLFDPPSFIDSGLAPRKLSLSGAGSDLLHSSTLNFDGTIHKAVDASAPDRVEEEWKRAFAEPGPDRTKQGAVSSAVASEQQPHQRRSTFETSSAKRQTSQKSPTEQPTTRVASVSRLAQLATPRFVTHGPRATTYESANSTSNVVAKSPQVWTSRNPSDSPSEPSRTVRRLASAAVMIASPLGTLHRTRTFHNGSSSSSSRAQQTFGSPSGSDTGALAPFSAAYSLLLSGPSDDSIVAALAAMALGQASSTSRSTPTVPPQALLVGSPLTSVRNSMSPASQTPQRQQLHKAERRGVLPEDEGAMPAYDNASPVSQAKGSELLLQSTPALLPAQSKQPLHRQNGRTLVHSSSSVAPLLEAARSSPQERTRVAAAAPLPERRSPAHGSSTPSPRPFTPVSDPHRAPSPGPSPPTPLHDASSSAFATMSTPPKYGIDPHYEYVTLPPTSPLLGQQGRLLRVGGRGSSPSYFAVGANGVDGRGRGGPAAAAVTAHLGSTPSGGLSRETGASARRGGTSSRRRARSASPSWNVPGSAVARRTLRLEQDSEPAPLADGAAERPDAVVAAAGSGTAEASTGRFAGAFGGFTSLFHSSHGSGTPSLLSTIASYPSLSSKLPLTRTQSDVIRGVAALSELAMSLPKALLQTASEAGAGLLHAAAVTLADTSGDGDSEASGDEQDVRVVETDADAALLCPPTKAHPGGAVAAAATSWPAAAPPPSAAAAAAPERAHHAARTPLLSPIGSPMAPKRFAATSTSPPITQQHRHFSSPPLAAAGAVASVAGSLLASMALPTTPGAVELLSAALGSPSAPAGVGSGLHGTGLVSAPSSPAAAPPPPAMIGSGTPAPGARGHLPPLRLPLRSPTPPLRFAERGSIVRAAPAPSAMVGSPVGYARLPPAHRPLASTSSSLSAAAAGAAAAAATTGQEVSLSDRAQALVDGLLELVASLSTRVQDDFGTEHLVSPVPRRRQARRVAVAAAAAAAAQQEPVPGATAAVGVLHTPHPGLGAGRRRPSCVTPATARRVARRAASAEPGSPDAGGQPTARSGYAASFTPASGYIMPPASAAALAALSPGTRTAQLGSGALGKLRAELNDLLGSAASQLVALQRSLTVSSSSSPSASLPSPQPAAQPTGGAVQPTPGGVTRGTFHIPSSATRPRGRPSVHTPGGSVVTEVSTEPVDLPLSPLHFSMLLSPLSSSRHDRAAFSPTGLVRKRLGMGMGMGGLLSPTGDAELPLPQRAAAAAAAAMVREGIGGGRRHVSAEGVEAAVASPSGAGGGCNTPTPARRGSLGGCSNRSVPTPLPSPARAYAQEMLRRVGTSTTERERESSKREEDGGLMLQRAEHPDDHAGTAASTCTVSPCAAGSGGASHAPQAQSPPTGGQHAKARVSRAEGSPSRHSKGPAFDAPAASHVPLPLETAAPRTNNARSSSSSSSPGSSSEGTVSGGVGGSRGGGSSSQGSGDTLSRVSTTTSGSHPASSLYDYREDSSGSTPGSNGSPWNAGSPSPRNAALKLRAAGSPRGHALSNLSRALSSRGSEEEGLGASIPWPLSPSRADGGDAVDRDDAASPPARGGGHSQPGERGTSARRTVVPGQWHSGATGDPSTFRSRGATGDHGRVPGAAAVTAVMMRSPSSSTAMLSPGTGTSAMMLSPTQLHALGTPLPQSPASTTYTPGGSPTSTGTGGDASSPLRCQSDGAGARSRTGSPLSPLSRSSRGGRSTTLAPVPSLH